VGFSASASTLQNVSSVDLPRNLTLARFRIFRHSGEQVVGTSQTDIPNNFLNNSHSSTVIVQQRNDSLGISIPSSGFLQIFILRDIHSYILVIQTIVCARFLMFDHLKWVPFDLADLAICLSDIGCKNIRNDNLHYIMRTCTRSFGYLQGKFGNLKIYA